MRDDDDNDSGSQLLENESEIKRRQRFPFIERIVPSCHVYWNSIKTGIDLSSRYLVAFELKALLGENEYFKFLEFVTACNYYGKNPSYHQVDTLQILIKYLVT